jgi:hypothetical protein
MPKPTDAQLAKYESMSWWPPEWKQALPFEPPPPQPPPPQPAAEVLQAFKDWRPTPDPAPAADDGEEKLPDPVTMAVRMLRQLSESPHVLSSVRVMSRRYLKKLAKSSQVPDEPDEDCEDDLEEDEDFRPDLLPAA